jgi:hypothetical protein
MDLSTQPERSSAEAEEEEIEPIIQQGREITSSSKHKA